MPNWKKSYLSSLIGFGLVLSGAQVAWAADHPCPAGLNWTLATVRGEGFGPIETEAGLRIQAGARDVMVCEMPHEGGQALVTTWDVLGEPGKTFQTIELFPNESSGSSQAMRLDPNSLVNADALRPTRTDGRRLASISEKRNTARSYPKPADEHIATTVFGSSAAE